jgi:hypothetical protein
MKRRGGGDGAKGHPGISTGAEFAFARGESAGVDFLSDHFLQHYLLVIGWLEFLHFAVCLSQCVTRAKEIHRLRRLQTRVQENHQESAVEE